MSVSVSIFTEFITAWQLPLQLSYTNVTKIQQTVQMSTPRYRRTVIHANRTNGILTLKNLLIKQKFYKKRHQISYISYTFSLKMTYKAVTFTWKMTSLLAFSANYHLKKSANFVCTVGLYATHMYGEVEGLTSLHNLLLS